MTDKEIIQALNTATNVDGLQICCIDYENNPKNAIYLSIKSDILDLINRQQAEIERLKEDSFIKSQKRANIFEITNAFERGRTDGIKKFAERLKEKVKFIYVDTDGDFVSELNECKVHSSFEEAIETLSSIVIKEMVGEQR